MSLSGMDQTLDRWGMSDVHTARRSGVHNLRARISHDDTKLPRSSICFS